MKIHRRKFLAITGLSLTGWLSGCARTQPLRARKLENWDLRSGQTITTQSLTLPEADWEALNSSDHGFLLASGASVLALAPDGRWHLYQGPHEALWVRPDLLVTGQSPSSTVFRLRAEEFPGGKQRWQQERNHGFLLGFNQDSVFVGHDQGVSCLSLDSGRELWKNSDLLELKSAFVEPSSLVLGLGNEGKIEWVDLKTGRLQRSLSTNKNFNRVVMLVGDDKMTAAFTRHMGLAGYPAGSSSPAWSQSIDNTDRSRLLGFSQGIALVEIYDSMVAVDIASGRNLWATSLAPRPSISQGVVLVARGSGLGAGELRLELEGLALSSGTSLWKRQLDDLTAVTAANGDKFAVLRA
ncbi:MAG: PQQ-binding-like beta-propeller repeat protein [Vulcanimicrobiota bacterium]